MRTFPTIFAANSSVLSVDIQSAVRRHLDWICVEPPINEIKMMRRLVHPQTAATRFQTMPATEVIGSVTGVEIPGEVDRRHASDLTRLDDLFYFLVLRSVAIVEGDDDLAFRFLLGVEHRLTLSGFGDHRL